jgi:lysophospholipase L1-like esterase
MATTDTTKTIADTGMSYLALGDSYTIGQSVEPSQSFPNILTSQLIRAHFNFNVDPTILATTGWTTGNLIDAINQSGLTGKKYDIVTLLIGVNDQYQGLNHDIYRINFKHLLDTAITFAGGNKNRVFVLSIPDYGVTPFADGRHSVIGPQIDQFNAINKQISNTAEVNYIDITGISRQAAKYPNLIASDGLHPSAEMYTEWVTVLEPIVAAQLKKN